MKGQHCQVLTTSLPSPSFGQEGSESYCAFKNCGSWWAAGPLGTGKEGRVPFTSEASASLIPKCLSRHYSNAKGRVWEISLSCPTAISVGEDQKSLKRKSESHPLTPLRMPTALQAVILQ